MKHDNVDFNWVLSPNICKDAEKILNQLINDPNIHVYIEFTDKDEVEHCFNLPKKVKITAFRIDTIEV